MPEKVHEIAFFGNEMQKSGNEIDLGVKVCCEKG